jgi:type II secretion system protein G
MSNSNKAGFTLIELLVVIAIIGLLASVVLVSLNSARAKARDAKRRGDLKQLATALALYYNENNAYPTTGGASAYRGNCPTFGSYGTSGPTGWIPSLSPTYLAVLPLDPKPDPPISGCYIYSSDGVDYKLVAYQAVENAVPNTDSMFDPPYGAHSLVIFTPGAKAW